MDDKIICIDEEVASSIDSAINLFANTVGSTLGPYGKPAILENEYGSNSYKVTKDGVSVARAIKLADPVKNAIISIAKEAAIKTNSNSGDGTTTSTVLMHQIYSKGIKLGSEVRNYRFLNGIKAATANVVDYIKSKSVSIDELAEGDDAKTYNILKNIAKISANGDDQIAESIATAFNAVGVNGSILVEDSPTPYTYVDINEGTQFPSGYCSPYFINSTDAPVCEFNDPLIFISDRKIRSSEIHDIITMIGEIPNKLNVDTKQFPIVLIAEDFDPDVIALFATNKLRGALNSVLIKLPAYGDDKVRRANDIGILTNAGGIISESCGVSFKNFWDFKWCTPGTVSRIIVKSDRTTLIGFKLSEKNKELLDSTLNLLEGQLASKELNPTEEYLARGRYNFLRGGIATIKVGANTEIEMKEKRDRIDDAVNSVKAAINGGIIPGGGIVLYEASTQLICPPTDPAAIGEDEFNIGYNLLLSSLAAPIKMIIDNSGIVKSQDALDYFDEIIAETNEKDLDLMTYDIEKLQSAVHNKTEVFYPALSIGVIDPTSVVVNALENAVSVATTLLSIKSIVVKAPTNKVENQ